MLAIIRSKAVAVLIGPEGIGIVGLLRSTTEIIQRMTNSGLNISAVRDITLANSSENEIKLSRTVIVFRRFIWLTGLLGIIVTLVFSSILSETAFGNKDYTLAFIWISVTLLLNQLCAGQITILQGLQKLKKLAKANLIGSTIGVIIGIPLYYFYGLEAIVPNIIIGSASALMISWLYTRNINVQKFHVSMRRSLIVGRQMIVLGFFLNITAFFNLAVNYVLRVFISNQGGLEQIGLYIVAITMSSTYVGMIFSGMSKEYYPRLTSVSNNLAKSKKTVNQQIEITLLIMAPLIGVFILFAGQLLILFYSDKFIKIDEMLKIMLIGQLIRGASWPIGYLFIAKGNVKLFSTSNIIFSCVSLALDLIFYSYWGLTGLGYSFLSASVFSLIFSLVLGNYFYQFKLDKTSILLLASALFLSVAMLCSTILIDGMNQYYIGFIILIVTISFSFTGLNKRMDLFELIKKILVKSKR